MRGPTVIENQEDIAGYYTVGSKGDKIVKEEQTDSEGNPILPNDKKEIEETKSGPMKDGIEEPSAKKEMVKSDIEGIPVGLITKQEILRMTQ